MKRPRPSIRFTPFTAGFALTAAMAISACGDDDSGKGGKGAGDGGSEDADAPGAGGRPAAGGGTAAGGKGSGGKAAGGSAGTAGGAPGSGGRGAGGASTGGEAGDGGASAGGAIGNGGASAGGAAGDGGASAGGAGGDGGGDAGSGGVPSAGGSEPGCAGGSSAGGATDGGTDDGGNSTDGGGPTDASTSQGPLTGIVTAVGSDFATKSVVSTIDLATKTVVGRVELTSTDVGVVASDGQAFILDRITGAIGVLSPTGTVDRTFPLDGYADALPRGHNPHALILVPGTSKGYVSMYDANVVLVVDVDAGAVTGAISFASLQNPDDGDASIDLNNGFFDPGTKRVYFVAGRTDVTDLFNAPYKQLCPTLPSLLLAIDTDTNEAVDLNGADPGVGLALPQVGTTDVVFDRPNGRALVLESGCWSASVNCSQLTTHASQGVDSVLLGSNAQSPLVVLDGPNTLNRFISLGASTAVVEAFTPDFGYQWNLYAYGAAKLGRALSGVPSYPTAVSEKTLVGFTVVPAGDAGSTNGLVRYDVATGDTEAIIDDAFAATGLYAGAVVRVR